MSCDQCYPMPQVYLVDGGGGGQRRSGQPPGLVPCWSFPPAPERAKKSRGVLGVSPCLAVGVLLMFLLVFAALGFEAYQIYNMQAKMRTMRQAEPVNEFNMAERQTGDEPEKVEEKTIRTAAHVLGRVEKGHCPHTLRWEPRAGQAFVSGEVTYQDGGLQVNQSGLYHIYTRVELIFRLCSLSSTFTHTVFVRRAGQASPLTLMEAHRTGFCDHRLVHTRVTDSYLGSTLHLQQNDRVYVNVSHPTLLSHEHYGNFFGLYEV
ncbi:tumor necrosis factor ligand superfamily member 6 [Betta splendens]|uniref:Tumor necrosis factor ligand superfamily member 6 n=1 Tax=Betta splendens TaxID=158456 RepID=A0A6P7ME73_BETSP|nr:tumor necrosis factor ligand superfamily member 6 [Betta splendens]